MKLLVAASAAVIWSSLNIDGEASITSITSSGVSRPVQGVVPAAVAAGRVSERSPAAAGPLMVAVTVTVSRPRFGPS